MAFTIPPGFKIGFVPERIDRRHGRIHVISDGKEAVFLDLSPDDLGTTAAAFLRLAYQLSQGTQPPSHTKRDISQLAVPVSILSLSQSPRPDRTILLLQAGEAVVGFELPTAELRELGENLIAASAEGRQ